MSERWYKEAIIYSVEVQTFQDSDGDGCGDLRGLISRLDYLARLGITCLWLNPIHPSPHRDDGYDVADYYAIDPRLGTLGDFAELALQARERGIRLLLDLVVNHTSDQHPWFQSARSDPSSPYRDWYVWSATEPADRRQGIVFPGEQTETWTFDQHAGEWYYHRFYDFQPDLNWATGAVREEVKRIMGFWIQLGASGFRIDAAPFVLELVQPDADPGPMDWTILDDWRETVQWRRGDTVLLCEANVDLEELPKYTAVLPEGPNDRSHMLFAFDLNARVWLALARRRAEPLVDALNSMPTLPAMAQWATFLRNHDELDLSRLTKEQRADVWRSFAPRETMRLYGRGIRRRLAPMLRADPRRIRLAYALQFALPGSPVLRYGEEIGMAEDLSLPDRQALRTPMQWEDYPHAGFSTAPKSADLVRPTKRTGRYGWRTVNVRQQEGDPSSLLRWFEHLTRTLRECPEIGVGTFAVIEVPQPGVLVHRFDAPEGSMLMIHNLDDRPVELDIGPLAGSDRPFDVLADSQYDRPSQRLRGLRLRGFGYRWVRLNRSNAV